MKLTLDHLKPLTDRAAKLSIRDLRSKGAISVRWWNIEGTEFVQQSSLQGQLEKWSTTYQSLAMVAQSHGMQLKNMLASFLTSQRSGNGMTIRAWRLICLPGQWAE